MDSISRSLALALQRRGSTTPVHEGNSGITHLCAKYADYFVRGGGADPQIVEVATHLSCTYDIGARIDRLPLSRIEAQLCHLQHAPRFRSAASTDTSTGFGLRASATVYGGLGAGMNRAEQFLAGDQTVKLDSLPAAPSGCVRRFARGLEFAATEADVRMFISAARGTGATDIPALMRQETAILAVGALSWRHPAAVLDAVELLLSLCRDAATNPWLRVVAATALSGGNGDVPGLVDGLASLITDETLDTCVRCRCILSLARIAEQDGVHRTIRRVIRFISEISGSFVTPPIVREAAINALAALGERSDAVAVPACLKVLSSESGADYWEQMAAIDALQRIPLPGHHAQAVLAAFCGLEPGAADVAGAVTVLPTHSFALRHLAAHVLHQLSLGGVDVKPALIPMCTMVSAEPDMEGPIEGEREAVEHVTRELAASLLLYLDHDSTPAVTALLTIIGNPDVDEPIKNRALQGLEVVGPSHAASVASALSAEYRRRASVLEAAGEPVWPVHGSEPSGKQRVATHILRSLQTIANFHPSTSTTYQALQPGGTAMPGGDFGTFYGGFGTFGGGVGSFGGGPGIRKERAAAPATGFGRTETAISEDDGDETSRLIRDARDRGPQVAYPAIEALVSKGTDEALAAVLHVFNDTDTLLCTRRYAAEQLLTTQHRGVAMRALTDMLCVSSTSDFDIAYTIESLKKSDLDDTEVDTLLPVLESLATGGRPTAVPADISGAAIGGEAPAAPPLPPSYQRDAMQLLARCGAHDPFASRVITVLLDVFTDASTHPQARGWALESLGIVPAAVGNPHITTALAHECTREPPSCLSAACKSLSIIAAGSGHPEAVEALSDLCLRHARGDMMALNAAMKALEAVAPTAHLTVTTLAAICSDPDAHDFGERAAVPMLINADTEENRHDICTVLQQLCTREKEPQELRVAAAGALLQVAAHIRVDESLPATEEKTGFTTVAASYLADICCSHKVEYELQQSAAKQLRKFDRENPALTVLDAAKLRAEMPVPYASCGIRTTRVRAPLEHGGCSDSDGD